MQELIAQPLTKEAFAPFGDVITVDGAEMRPINRGTTERFHDLADLTISGDDSRIIVSIFRSKAYKPPVEIAMMERHPLGSQAFMPLHDRPWLVVVAADDGGKPGVPLAFVVEPDAHGLRGVNYAANVWHHPLIALGETGDFLVIDRDGPGENLQECSYPSPFLVALPAP